MGLLHEFTHGLRYYSGCKYTHLSPHFDYVSHLFYPDISRRKIEGSFKRMKRAKPKMFPWKEKAFGLCSCGVGMRYGQEGVLMFWLYGGRQLIV